MEPYAIRKWIHEQQKIVGLELDFQTVLTSVGLKEIY